MGILDNGALSLNVPRYSIDEYASNGSFIIHCYCKFKQCIYGTIKERYLSSLEIWLTRHKLTMHGLNMFSTIVINRVSGNTGGS